ncbi:MAG TPA: hypothetical protein VJQ43_06620 [Thermoplasmata archaeon]|nr:hypothetical protein [Thermoplasmata archaeon]
MVSLTSNDIGTIVVVALILVFLARRIVGMVRGAPVSPPRLFGFAILFTFLFVVGILSTFSEMPPWTYALDAAVVVAASVLATWYVQRIVVIERRNDGWYYRLGVAIPVAYVALFATRLVLDVAVLGIDPFAPPMRGPVLTGTTLLVLATVDALFAFSTGLLIGRSLGVYLEFRKNAGAQVPPSAPAAPPTTPRT